MRRALGHWQSVDRYKRIQDLNGKLASNLEPAVQGEPDRVGKIRVLIIGNSGSGKTSLAHLLAYGKHLAHATPTVGCNTFVKLVEYPEPSAPGQKQDYFVELWDVGAHERYKPLRSAFYTQLNGVILVHELSNPRSRAGLHKWAAEVAAAGSFSAPSRGTSSVPQLGGLPVPVLTIGTKADISGSSYAVAQQRRRAAMACWLGDAWGAVRRVLWRRRQTEMVSPVVSSPADLESDPSFAKGLTSCATEGRIDMHAVNAFFQELIERRYYAGEASGLRSQSNSFLPPPLSRIGSMTSVLSDAFGGGNGSGPSSVASPGGFSRASAERTTLPPSTGRVDDGDYGVY